MTELERLRERFKNYQPKQTEIQGEYAVLCPLTEQNGELYLLFEVRAAGIRQAGEVCFPGGRMEPGESDINCALRETQEELSIPRQEIEILGRMDYLYHQRGFLLRPILGKINPSGIQQIKPSISEVAEVFYTPLSFFQNTKPEIYQYKLNPDPPAGFPYDKIGVSPSYPWASGRVEVPVWYWDNHAIWGLTARIIRELIKNIK